MSKAITFVLPAVAFAGVVTLALGGTAGTFVSYLILGVACSGIGLAVVRGVQRHENTGWWLVLATAVWGVWMLVVNSAGDGGLGFLVYFLGALAFGFLMLFLTIAVFLRERGARHWSLKPYLPVLIQFALLSVIFVGVSLGGAFALRFWASRPALESAAQDVLSGKTVPPGRIGLFRVSEIERADGAARFIIGQQFLDDAGLVFSPGDEPPVVGEDSYEHITGDWWGWRRSW